MPVREQSAAEWADERSRLLHALQVHQLELELQNSELREAQERLEESRSRYAELYERAPIGYVTLGQHGLIEEINRTGAALLGRKPAQLVGAPFAALVRGGRAFQAYLDKCAGGAGPRKTEVDLKVDRDEMAVELTTTPHTRDGQVVGFLMVMSDISDRRRADTESAKFELERQARAAADAANKMKDQFLGIVSHELKTPLTAILGWAHLLRARSNEAGSQLPEPAIRGLRAIERNSEALARIVDDILDVSRIVSGKLRVEMAETNLAELVRAVMDQARASAEAKSLALRLVRADDCVVSGDGVRLQQVFSNLLSNAVKFSEKGGAVEVSLERLPVAARLHVKDSGCGILAADLPHLFEYFRQADDASRRPRAGLGLGLAIARHIVEAHGGHIVARSAGAGEGAEFTVELPCRLRVTTARPAEDLDTQESADLAGLRVLCVDDEPDTLEIVALMLSDRGATVATARSAEEAIQRLLSVRPDAVVSDLSMPGMDGADLVEAIRQMAPPLSGTPALALTACLRPGDIERIKRAGFDAHLGKPVKGEELARTVAALASKRRTSS
jgi:PAS domain S-box-containing protein